MHQALYISEYSDHRAKRAKSATHLGREIDWTSRLPDAWRDRVDGPMWVQVFRDHSCGAERWVGFNEDDRPCWVRYRFVIEHAPGESGQGARAVRHCEDLMGWLMRDGRWLIHRTILSQAERRPASYSFFALSERMPR